jgi:hypothetical protein
MLYASARQRSFSALCYVLVMIDPCSNKCAIGTVIIMKNELLLTEILDSIHISFSLN